MHISRLNASKKKDSIFGLAGAPGATEAMRLAQLATFSPPGTVCPAYSKQPLVLPAGGQGFLNRRVRPFVVARAAISLHLPVFSCPSLAPVLTYRPESICCFAM